MHPYPASMHFAITPLCIYRYSYQLVSSHSWSVKSKGEINIFHPCKVVSKGTLTYRKLTSKYPHRGRLTGPLIYYLDIVRVRLLDLFRGNCSDLLKLTRTNAVRQLFKSFLFLRRDPFLGHQTL